MLTALHVKTGIMALHVAKGLQDMHDGKHLLHELASYSG
jgi:hypothetical protein